MIKHILFRTLQVAAVVLLIHLTSPWGHAQSTPSDDAPELLPPITGEPATTNPPTTVVRPLDAPQIVELSRSGLDERIIVDLVRERGVARPLTVEDLLFLRRNRVSNEVIRAMQQAAPRGTVYSTPPTVVHIDPPPPPPVVIRTVPSYYWSFGAPIYVRPHHGYPYHAGPHSRGGGRISFGFAF